eukprot:1129740-Amphidinium_carterae.2
MASLEALLPEDLEKHVQLQRSRLDTYQKLREEVVGLLSYMLKRGIHSHKAGRPGETSCRPSS